MSELSTTFENIIDMMQGKTPLPGTSDIPADDAFSEFQNILSQTILPRRITLRGAEGARVSVIGKNRRIVNLSEVHPQSHWTGDSAPEETECQADDDKFSAPFVSALIQAVDGESIRIEQALLTDPLKTSKAGYPVTRLVENINEAQKQAPAGEHIVSFFQENDGLPRARFGREIEVTIPADSEVSHDWMQARIDEALDDLIDKKSDLRFLVIEGEAPMALALAWLKGEGVIIRSDDPESFDDLEQKLSTLRANL